MRIRTLYVSTFAVLHLPMLTHVLKTLNLQRDKPCKQSLCHSMLRFTHSQEIWHMGCLTSIMCLHILKGDYRFLVKRSPHEKCKSPCSISGLPSCRVTARLLGWPEAHCILVLDPGTQVPGHTLQNNTLHIKLSILNSNKESRPAPPPDRRLRSSEGAGTKPKPRWEPGLPATVTARRQHRPQKTAPVVDEAGPRHMARSPGSRLGLGRPSLGP